MQSTLHGWQFGPAVMSDFWWSVSNIGSEWLAVPAWPNIEQVCEIIAEIFWKFLLL